MWKSISVIILMNGLKIQWVNSIIDSGSNTKDTINFLINFTSKDSWTSNLDYLFISTIAGSDPSNKPSKTNNSITWHWDTRTIQAGGIIAIGY